MKDNWFIPLIYVLACDKKTTTYEEIFDELLKLQPDLKPNHITIDFEQSTIKALKSKFPTSNIHGCNFHFGQNLWRHIQQVGLQTKYSSDPDFALNIRLVLSLAFVPTADVEEAFQQLASSEFYL